MEGTHAGVGCTCVPKTAASPRCNHIGMMALSLSVALQPLLLPIRHPAFFCSYFCTSEAWNLASGKPSTQVNRRQSTPRKDNLPAWLADKFLLAGSSSFAQTERKVQGGQRGQLWKYSCFFLPPSLTMKDKPVLWYFTPDLYRTNLTKRNIYPLSATVFWQQEMLLEIDIIPHYL